MAPRFGASQPTPALPKKANSRASPIPLEPDGSRSWHISVTHAFQLDLYRCIQWQHNFKEAEMFTELSEELLDLTVHESGYRNALYAKVGDPGGCSCSTGSSSSLTCCKFW